jgi:hypothetical protein
MEATLLTATERRRYNAVADARRTSLCRAREVTLALRARAQFM